MCHAARQPEWPHTSHSLGPKLRRYMATLGPTQLGHHNPHHHDMPHLKVERYNHRSQVQGHPLSSERMTFPGVGHHGPHHMVPLKVGSLTWKGYNCRPQVRGCPLSWEHVTLPEVRHHAARHTDHPKASLTQEPDDRRSLVQGHPQAPPAKASHKKPGGRDRSSHPWSCNYQEMTATAVEMCIIRQQLESCRQ